MLIRYPNFQKILIGLLAIALFIIVFLAVSQPQRATDINMHIQKQISIFNGEATTAYPIMYVCTEGIHQFFQISRESAYGIFIALCTTSTAFMFFFLYRKNTSVMPLTAFLGALCVSIILHIYFPGWILNLYYGQGSPNAWHNPSSLTMRPFSVISFISFSMLIDKQVLKKEASAYTLINCQGIKDNVLYAVFLLSTVLSLLAKPSYVFGFIFAAAILFLIRIRFFDKRFILTMAIGCLITVCILCLQYSEIFKEDSGQSGGIVFSFSRAIYYIGLATPSVPLSILSHLVYPIVFLMLFYKKINVSKNNLYLLSWLFYIVSMVMYLSISQVDKPTDGNIGWTRSSAILMLQMTTTLEYLKCVAGRNVLPSGKKILYSAKLIAVFVCLILQLYPGILWLASFVVK